MSPSFEQMSAPVAGGGVNLIVYAGKHGSGFSAHDGVQFSLRHGWFGVSSPTPPVPEPATSLLLACGLAAIYLWRRL